MSELHVGFFTEILQEVTVKKKVKRSIYQVYCVFLLSSLLYCYSIPNLYLYCCCSIVEVIYQTRERVFHQDIQTPRSGLKKRGAAEFFNRLRGVWIPDETLFRVFDMASQTIHNSWRNSREKFAKLYAN